MKDLYSLTFHSGCAIFHMYAIHWLMFGMGLNILEMASFFTIWTTVFHLVMFLTLAAHDVTRLLDLKLAKKTLDSSSKSIADIVLTSEGFLGLFLHLAVVMSSFTQVVFWLLFHIDREMILPDTVGLPSLLNHMLHTFPLFLALAAVNIFASNFPNTKEERYCKTMAKTGVQIVAFAGFAYLTFIWILFEIKGVWPYRFMFSFSRVDYVIFSVCSFLFSFMLCYICSLIEIRIKNIKVL